MVESITFPALEMRGLGCRSIPAGNPVPVQSRSTVWPHRTPNIIQKKTGHFFNTKKSFVWLRQIIFAFHPGIFQYQIRYLRGAAAAAHCAPFLPAAAWVNSCRRSTRVPVSALPGTAAVIDSDVHAHAHPQAARARGNLLPVKCCLVTATAEPSPPSPLPVSTQAGSNLRRPREPSRSSSEQELLCLCWLG